SFASYYDPRFMGFGPLRVINEDKVEAARGFGRHPHRNMEIISYVVSGQLEHRDSMGTGSVITPGEVQLMSAGTGVTHSEMNPSTTDGVHFLQIWIQPAQMGTAPRYAQKRFDSDGVVLLVSPDGRDDSLVVGQDVDLYRVRLTDEAVNQALRGRRGWVQLISGALTINGAGLRAGDGLMFEDLDAVTLTATGVVEALLFDMAV
ncbi:MAG: redox-sensitive bicupin YhaK (pirin superfamily), partial [Myxococcota bacterium]